MLNKYIYTLLIFILLSVLTGSLSPLHAQHTEAPADRNAYLRAVNALYAQGKWDEGKKIAEEHLASEPKDADMRMLLGKYYVHRKEYATARYELVKCLGRSPNNVEAKQMLVTVETETARYSSAICYINELLEVNPYGKDLWRKKMELYRQTGNEVEADRLLKRMAQIYPEDIEIQRDQAYIANLRATALQKEGKLDASIALSRKAIEEQPKEQGGYIALIDSYIKAGDYGNALIYTERGLNAFPNNGPLAQKKIAILEHQQRYPEILNYLESEMKKGNSSVRPQYNYMLLETARQARANSPATLYGKIFQASPGNKEAYSVVFNDLVAAQQYEEALQVLQRHRSSSGNSKQLEMQELMLYKRIGNTGKVRALTESLFAKYPEDSDLQESMLSMHTQRAKDHMQDGRLSEAIADWSEVLRYGDAERSDIARHGLYNTYLRDNRYTQALVILDEMLAESPDDPSLLLKKSDLYARQGKYDDAITTYEQALAQVTAEDRDRYIAGFGELITPIIKDQNEAYALEEAQTYLERWLQIDPQNKAALLYLINNHYQRRDFAAMLRVARQAQAAHPDDIAFQLKLAEALHQQPEQRGEAWSLLHTQIQRRPYHVPLQNTFSAISETYVQSLLDQKEHAQALARLDTVLQYDTHNKSLLYLKGLAYEGLKQYDSAYVYQQYYEPSLLELADFKQHLHYLNQRSYENVFGIYHLRARFGEDYTITSISSADYTRIGKRGTYTARVHYAGREQGKGIQGQIEWTKPWTDKFSTRFDAAFANQFFATRMLNAHAFYLWKPTWEAEAGVGYRGFRSGENLYNLNLGVTKELEDFRLSAKLSNFALDDNYLYSVFFRGQYFMSSPKNYLMVLSSVGNSPDVDLINYQLTNSFNVFNTMVGAGIGRSLTRNVHASIVGSWYNFRRDTDASTNTYRNLYNAYFQVNVSF